MHRLRGVMPEPLRRAARVVRRRPAGPSPEPRAEQARSMPVGMVEQFSRRLVAGWVSAPAGDEPVVVSLHLGRLQVASTYATPKATMSGANSRLRRRTQQPPPVAVRPSEAVHPAQLPHLPGPPGDARNSRQQIHIFGFRVRGIWAYVKKTTPITVRVGGRPLPIYGHGMFLLPPRNGAHSVQELREKLANGWVLSQFGDVQLSKRLDTDWQRKVMALYVKVGAIVRESHGYDPFLIYGTLLGQVREDGYIGHDADFDAAYLSRHRNGADAARELVEIGLTLVDAGLRVDCMAETLHVTDPGSSIRIDLFHTYFDEDGVLSLPFGYAGEDPVRHETWQGLHEVEFSGGRAFVPVDAEAVVRHLYGRDWRRPKPGFNWHLDRVGWAADGVLTDEQRSTVYWADFYSHMGYQEGSRFFEFVNSRPGIPETVVDVGCGDGRDACAFGAAGRHVLGIDRAAVGIDHARQHAEQAGLADRVSFEVCDASDEVAFAKLLEERPADQPTLFYLRFFLHAITAAQQQSVLRVIADAARAGDMLAAEFRTDKDERTAKTHGGHYRRYQNAARFQEQLVSDYGFTLVHAEEGSGLSPYGDEDPVLCRVVAVREATTS